jgi:DNA primase
VEPDPEADELAAKRARALRHALAEYELKSFVVTPGRPLGEILAR